MSRRMRRHIIKIIVRPASLCLSLRVSVALVSRCAARPSIVPRDRSRGGNRRDEGSQGSALRFDELREFEPIRFVLECTLRLG